MGSIRDVMTSNPTSCEPSTSVVDAAKVMAREDVGPVPVVEGGRVVGIVTDRDLVVRSMASGRDPHATPVGSLCSKNLVTVTPDQSIDDVIQLIREHNIRRVPVVQDGRPVGILSIGDLAMEVDEHSALADLSAAPPNN